MGSAELRGLRPQSPRSPPGTKSPPPRQRKSYGDVVGSFLLEICYSFSNCISATSRLLKELNWPEGFVGKDFVFLGDYVGRSSLPCGISFPNSFLHKGQGNRTESGSRHQKINLSNRNLNFY